jgi:acyl dehydratase
MSEADVDPGAGWREAQALLDAEVGAFAGPDAVCAADIRRKLEVIGLDCALHHDETVAREHGYRTIVAPVSMTRTWALGAFWSPGVPVPGTEPMHVLHASQLVPGPGDTTIASHLRLRHEEPLHPGDRVTASAVLRSVTPKTTRVGAGAFFVVETTYANQRGATVSVETATLFRTTRAPAAGAPAATGRPAPPACPALEDAVVGPSPPFALVRPGAELAPLRVPITLQRLIMEAGANRDFSPWHYDRAAAAALGARGVTANTTFVETLLEAVVRRWAGLSARIDELELTLRDFVCEGDVACAGGAVTAVREDAGARTAHVDVWIDTERGRTTSGSAVVSFPRAGDA